MDINAISALSAYTYQSALTQSGSAAQALTQSLSLAQSQSASVGGLLASAGSVDPLAALAGGSETQALASLAYSASEASGTGSESVQALLAALGTGSSALLTTSTALPTSAVGLSPSATEALARYAYDQSQNPTHTIAQTAAAGQQALLASTLNLLA
jgi:hypothetical protein